jgi:hypothetical protein
VKESITLILAITVPCFTALVGMLVNNHAVAALRTEMHTGFTDIKGQIDHLLDLHINHAERIATLEERTKPKEGSR